MKKIISILLAVLVIGGCFRMEAKTTKKHLKSKTTATKRTNKSNSSSGLKYGSYYYIPFNGKIPTVESYGFKKSDGIKRVVQTAYDTEFIGFGDYILEFDKDGRLILFESCPDDWYHPERYIFTYNEDGKLSTVNYLNIDGAQDNLYMPLINGFYEYKWSDDKIIEISEKLLIDQGINYKGQPTHLDLFYNENGYLTSAVCRENPKVYFKFDHYNRVIDYGNYSCAYKKEQRYVYSHITGLDPLFHTVNKKKVALNWFYLPSSMSFDRILPEFSIDENIDNSHGKPIVLNDPKGNWIEKRTRHEGGETVIERKITYF